MGASILSVYNKALRWLEERPLAALTEPREPRRLLDTEWTDAVATCLYAGFWNFAMRERMATPDVAQAPNFGFQYVFTKPTDWVRTFQISEDDRFEEMVKRYADQNNVWYADISPLYIRHTSNDPNFGLNMSLWTPAFVEYLACYLALMCAPRIKQASAKTAEIEKRVVMFKKDALAKDAMDQPPGKIPFGSWVLSRAPRGSMYPMGGGWDQD